MRRPPNGYFITSTEYLLYSKRLVSRGHEPLTVLAVFSPIGWSVIRTYCVDNVSTVERIPSSAGLPRKKGLANTCVCMIGIQSTYQDKISDKITAFYPREKETNLVASLAPFKDFFGCAC